MIRNIKKKQEEKQDEDEGVVGCVSGRQTYIAKGKVL